MQETNGLKKIYNMYKDLTYFDQYSGSIALMLFILIILFLIVSYCLVMMNIKPIQDNWPTERCKLGVMPFAGMINTPDGTSSIDYTNQNFSYCIQNILSTIAGTATEPVTFIMNMIQELFKSIKDAINSIRAMFDKIRTEFQRITGEIMGRILNMMIPLQSIIIALKDFLSKLQGVMAAGLFTLLGAFMTLQSLFGAIAEFIIMILITLAAIVMVLWIVPVTWGAAASMTVIFLAISIPMTLILVFMTVFLKVKPSISIPTIKCFDKNTELIIIKQDQQIIKKIEDIEVGDILYPNNQVTAKIKVLTEGSRMYRLENIIVSDSHKIKYNNRWINIYQHPDAVELQNYGEKFLYCLNTKNKRIFINKYEFSDWDEYLQNDGKTFNLSQTGMTKHNIISLKETKKSIDLIQPGDKLYDNNIVYGIVEIDSININQFKFLIGDKIISGSEYLSSPNYRNLHFLSLDKKNKNIIKNHDKLYHLLTGCGNFRANDLLINDYNYCIDKFIS
jgi:hypothetical protein